MTRGLSEAQLAKRLQGITATDIAAIVGVHPHRKPIDVYLDKAGLAPPFVPNLRSKWGQILEPSIRADYEELHGCHVEVPGTLHHPSFGWQMATPDGIVYLVGAEDPERGLEIKVHGREAVWFGGLEYGDPGTDEVPAHELVQCAWNMRVTQLEKWDLVAFLDGWPREYTIARDLELESMLVEAAERFRTDYVDAGELPPPDGSESWNEWLKQRWKGKSIDDANVLVLEPDSSLRGVIAELKGVRDQINALTDRKDLLGQLLKKEIGDKAGIRWIDPERRKPSSITWKRNKDGVVTDWREVAGEHATTARLALMATRADLETVSALLVEAPEFAGDEAVIAASKSIIAAVAALAEIAGPDVVVKHTKTVEGARPFNMPHHWKRNVTEKKEG